MRTILAHLAAATDGQLVAGTLLLDDDSVVWPPEAAAPTWTLTVDDVALDGPGRDADAEVVLAWLSMKQALKAA